MQQNMIPAKKQKTKKKQVNCYLSKRGRSLFHVCIISFLRNKSERVKRNLNC